MKRFRFFTRTAFIAMTVIATYFVASRLYQSWFTHRYGYYVLGMKLRRTSKCISFDRVRSSFKFDAIATIRSCEFGQPRVGMIRHENGFRNASFFLNQHDSRLV